MLLFTIFLSIQFCYCQNFSGLNVRQFNESKVFIDDKSVRVDVETDSVQFFVIGDWGGIPSYPFKTVVQQNVADQMAQLAQIHNTQFQLALGDNFYYNGVESENDERFQDTFENVYISIYLQNPWFFVLGSLRPFVRHRNATAQIEYTKKSKRWIFPDYNYIINVTVNGETLISILMIDTIILCSISSTETKYATTADRVKAEKLFVELEQTLKRISETNVKYIIVAGHYTVWSTGLNGPTKCLIEKLRPLLHKYGVSAYFCGHEHKLEHISDSFMGNTVEHIVSGAANFNHKSIAHLNEIPKNSLKFQWSPNNTLLHGGLVLITANNDKMTILFYESTGIQLHQTIIRPRQ